MKIFAIVLFALLSATMVQAATSRVDVTGRVTSVIFYNDRYDNLEGPFELSDPKLVGWAPLAEISMTSGSMTFRERWVYGELDIETENCSGLLRFACEGYYYADVGTTLANFEYDFYAQCFSCVMEFSPQGYVFDDDSDWFWTNSLGRFNAGNGARVTVEFDSFLVDRRPFPSPVPVAPALPLAATAFGLLFGLRRLRRRG